MIFSSNYVVDHITTCVTFLDWSVTPDILPYSLSFQDPKNNLKITTPYGFFFFFSIKKRMPHSYSWNKLVRMVKSQPKNTKKQVCNELEAAGRQLSVSTVKLSWEAAVQDRSSWSRWGTLQLNWSLLLCSGFSGLLHISPWNILALRGESLF